MHAAVHGVEIEATKRSLGAAVFAIWFAVLHVPRALAHMDARPEWTSLFVAITLCGGGLLIRQTLARGGQR